MLIDEDDFFDFENGEEILVISPCGGKNLFVQSGNSINFIRLQCGNFPNAIKTFGQNYKTMLKEIEKQITKHRAYKNVPESRCIFY